MRADRVTVRGTVTPPDATVQIVGQPAQVGNGVFTGSVALHRGANTIDVVASAAGAAPATTTITVKRPGQRPRLAPDKSPQVKARRAPPLSRTTNCGDGLTAGAWTWCPFAENVRTEYEQSGSGMLNVYSPTTGQTYRMLLHERHRACVHGWQRGIGLLLEQRRNDELQHDRLWQRPPGRPTHVLRLRRECQIRVRRQRPRVDLRLQPGDRPHLQRLLYGSSPHVCTGGNNAAVYFP